MRVDALVLGVAAAVLCACVTSATNLDANPVPAGYGVVLGRIRAFGDTGEVTASCRAVFSDERNEEREDLPLGREGWVISALPKGRMYLSTVWCIGDGALVYQSRELDFDVAGNGRITYFGDLRFKLHAQTRSTS